MGTAYVTKKKSGNEDNDPSVIQLSEVEDLLVFNDFVGFKFSDGSVVLERSDSITNVQFTPTSTESDTGSGESTDDTGD